MNSNVLLAGAIISLVAFFPFPVGFYTFTRIAISLCSAYAAYCFYKDGKNIWIIMVLVTILYNPILPVYLYDRGLWQILNILTALIGSPTYLCFLKLTDFTSPPFWIKRVGITLILLKSIQL